METIVVGIAEGKIAKASQVLVSYALGSCVGVCLYDTKNKIAGMAHVMLPSRPEAHVGSNAYKFADAGVQQLIRDMTCKGASKDHMKAKIAGGARMFAAASVGFDIGAKNVMVVKMTLKIARIQLIGEDTGQDYGRTILFSADRGSLEVRSLKGGRIVL